MNVSSEPMTVTMTLSVQILMVRSTATVLLDSMEMEPTVKVQMLISVK